RDGWCTPAPVLVPDRRRGSHLLGALRHAHRRDVRVSVRALTLQRAAAISIAPGAGGIRKARTMATMKSAGTSPMRCPRCSGYTIDCAAMMPACTKLDQIVNQMRLRLATGSRDAMM